MVSPAPDAAAPGKLDTGVDGTDEPPTVHSLMQEVARLQQVVRALSNDDAAVLAECTSQQYNLKTRPANGEANGFSGVAMGSGPQVATSMDRTSSVCTNAGAMVHGEELNRSVTGLRTPPLKRRERPAVSPTTRIASLTKENISLLPTPRTQHFAGSVCGSQQSCMSIRTEGGTVFSRLYQPDFYKKREEKYESMRERRDSVHCAFTPRTNRRASISSRDSIDTESQASMQSAKTDVLNVSSRLYDPSYVRKRNARLQRLRQEREMRDCTFTPVINAKKGVRYADQSKC
ncbi:unnamed protein product [Hyaloperonospora brassicae]|uniref:Uncharacterized protein n=1 Tax=Hyaloperonospora brassicae TaxID=162125 RepID=A0AAV0TTU4_HYABA|nr:unnamed protein product [Hyaloperonospora brassicae]